MRSFYLAQERDRIAAKVRDNAELAALREWETDTDEDVSEDDEEEGEVYDPDLGYGDEHDYMTADQMEDTFGGSGFMGY